MCLETQINGLNYVIGQMYEEIDRLERDLSYFKGCCDRLDSKVFRLMDENKNLENANIELQDLYQDLYTEYYNKAKELRRTLDEKGECDCERSTNNEMEISQTKPTLRQEGLSTPKC